MPLPFLRPATLNRPALHACIASVLGLCACASSPGGGGLADKALDLVGLQTRRSAAEQAASEAPVPKPRRITLRIHAGDLLNSDASGRSLSLVAKVYALKDADGFLEARYAAFKDAGAAPGATEMHEIVLTPGRRYEVVETVGEDIRYIGVVGLFRTPDEKRWRFAFDVKTAAVTGITVGAHGCALSVSEGEPIRTSPESMRLAGMQCR